ncbi:arsenate reductase [Hahella ganghwensis]|uniref:arsenate reductase n=1 Tax=Hahella ganghwensis TaxID=286420 RepID=UPI0003664710|nr:arsenate reductase [Hahella ganghwensis]
MIKLYGIPNCDTVKKTRKWLNDAGLEHEFHDYKKQGVPVDSLRRWLEQAGTDSIINKRGTTWRKLSEEEKSSIETIDGTITLLEQNSSVIKRPIIESEERLIVGFNPDQLDSLK